MNGRIELVLQIHGVDLADVEVADLSRNLREELLTLDVDDARPAHADSPPPGAKAGEAVAFGTLLVTVAPVLAGGVIDIVASWLRRQPDTIEVDIGGQRLKGRVTAEQRDGLVTALLDQLSAPSGPP